MKTYEIRTNCEYVIVIEADTEEESLACAEATPYDEWGQSWAPLECAEVEDQGDPPMLEVSHDVIVTNEGTIWAFYLETPAAQAWVEENMETEPYQWLGEHILCVSHGCGSDLVLGMRDGGLTVVGREVSAP